MSEFGWLIVGAALCFFLVKYGYKGLRAYHAASEKERMRRALDWDNSYRRERHRKRVLSKRGFWQRLGLFD